MGITPIVEVRGLEARYNSRIILENIQFSVSCGEIFMIVGESGCGKTTLLNHMIGLLKPYAGSVLIDGRNIGQSGDAQRLEVLKKIGVLYQSNALFGSMSLLENVSLPLEELTRLPPDAIAEIARSKLNMVGLSGFGDYMPAQISGGMQKRAAIARAMALDPKVLFLDEPSSGLDPINSFELDKLIINLANVLGITFVIVSHDLLSICKIAQRVILLYNGRIIGEGKPRDLCNSTNPVVNNFFEYKSI